MQEDKLKDEQAKDNSVKAFVMPSFDSPRNWKEDYPHENGNYLCKCYQCNEHFYGHKRRPLCKECFDKIRCFLKLRLTAACMKRSHAKHLI